MPEQIVRVGVTDFVTYTYEDLQDATNSRFIQKILQLRKTVDSISYDLDLDKAALNKVRKSVKSVYGSGKAHIQSESDLSNLLAELGNYAIDEGADSVGSALSKFSVVTKETNSYFANLMQNLSNIVLSPLETFIKVEMKSDMKKGFDRALKEYESKFDKIKKEKVQAAKEAGHTKTDVSMSEIQEELERERRMLQLQLCEFFIKANDVKTKKRSSLLQYFIDYYTAQMMYFEESVKTLKHLGCYMQDMLSTVEELRTEQDEERRTLVKLREELRNAMTERELATDNKGHHVGRRMSLNPSSVIAGSFSASLPSTSSTATAATLASASASVGPAAAPSAASGVAAGGGTGGYSLHQGQGNRAHGTCKHGYLMKRSDGKVKKVWQRRRATVAEDRFLLYHADESKPPVSLLLLTCQVRQSPEDRSKRTFRLISNNRTYCFQCDSGPEAERWVSVLNNAKEKVFQAAMGAAPLGSGGTSGAGGDAAGCSPAESLRAAIIREIRGLPGNNVCADCCTADPEWISTNLGVLICLECCGIHRDLGVHISRTQSLVMDELTTAQLLVARFVGNKMFNEVFEAVMPENVKPRCSVSNSTDLHQLMDTRKIFIRAKYIDRCYVYRTTGLASIPGDRPDAVEGLQSLKGDLLKAVCHQNMPLLLQAFAEGCDLLAQYTNGETALHVLLREGDECVCLAIVDFMLQNSPPAALRRATVSGDTLLHYCVNYNRPDCLKLCLRTSLSACAGARNHSGLAAMDICDQLSLNICADLFRALDNGSTGQFEHMTNFEWRLSTGGAGGVVGQSGLNLDEDFSDDENPIASGAGGGSGSGGSGSGDFPQLRTLTSSSAGTASAAGGGYHPGGSQTLRQQRGWSYYPSPSRSPSSAASSTPKASGAAAAATMSQQQSPSSSRAGVGGGGGGGGGYGSGFVTLPRRPSKVKKAPAPPPPQPQPPTTSSVMSTSLYGAESMFKSPLPANPNRSNGSAQQQQQQQPPLQHHQLRRAGSYDNIDVIIDALMEDPAGEADDAGESSAGATRRPHQQQQPHHPQPQPRHTLHKAVPDGPTNPNWSSPRISGAFTSPHHQPQLPQQQPPPKRAPKPKIDKSLLLLTPLKQPAPQLPPSQPQPQPPPTPPPPAPIASSDSDAEPPAVAVSSPLGPPVRCVAMYDCKAEFPNELSFAKGEVLLVTRRENEDWWEAEIEGETARRGLFPVSFVHFMS